MENNLFLITKETFRQIKDSCEVNENIKNHNEIMRIIIKKSSSNKLYHVFSVGKEMSRIKFLKIEKFPDALFISLKPDGNIHCYICELKRTPANNLNGLSLQLFSGYMHCKLLLSALHVDIDKITYSYHVFMINDQNEELEYHNLPNTPLKMIPGKPRVSKNEYDYWKADQLYLKKNTFKFNVPIKKHQMIKKDNSNEYHYELNL